MEGEIYFVFVVYVPICCFCVCHLSVAKNLRRTHKKKWFKTVQSGSFGL